MTGYNRYTGDQKHGNRYCHSCGDQTPIGFQHFHAEDLLKANDTLRDQLRTATVERDKYHDALIARHGGEPVALLSELDEARERLAEAKARAEVAEALADTLGHPVKSPCGHCSSYAVTDDGGKNIRCLLCREAHLEAALANVPHLYESHLQIGTKTHVGFHVLTPGVPEHEERHHEESCARLGGRCALTEALAATGGKDKS